LVRQKGTVRETETGLFDLFDAGHRVFSVFVLGLELYPVSGFDPLEHCPDDCACAGCSEASDAKGALAAAARPMSRNRCFMAISSVDMGIGLYVFSWRHSPECAYDQHNRCGQPDI
jgi:hypothetical protein